MKSEKKLIEMVCSGNSGRSPVAELIGRNWLKSVGENQFYNTRSSGIYVKDVKEFKETGRIGFPLKAVIPIIDFAKKRGDIYTIEQLAELNKALKSGDRAIIDKYLGVAVQIFGGEEVGNREAVLSELGIEGKAKTGHDQTKVNPNAIAVFVMDHSQKPVVEGIYQKSDKDGISHNPVIEVLSAYGTGIPDAELTDSFGRGKDVYKAMIERMVVEVPKAIEKLISHP